MPHRRNGLVENGVLKGFIYDLQTAGQAGVKSTGNASRGYFAPFNSPNSAFTNLILQPDQTPLKDIVAGINESILVESLLGLG
jgi:predicted Zn-dependent protease